MMPSLPPSRRPVAWWPCLLHIAWLLVLGALAAPVLAEPMTVTDVLGREVRLQAPAQRVVLAQGRHFQLLSLLTPNPAAVLAGWSDEYKTSFGHDYELALEQYPELAQLPIVGRHTPETFSIERTLAARPDLVILTAAFAGIKPGDSVKDSPLLSKLEAAEVPTVVVDFFLKPLENTKPSLRLLGQALGQSEQAERFIAFYDEHMQHVAAQLEDLPKEQYPPVFMHAHAGMTDCCYSPGVGVFNDMIEYAGGHNIGADVLKSPTGALNFEYINASEPQIYVATGIGNRARAGMAAGAGVQLEDARASLEQVIKDNRLGALPAVRHGQAHGVWHAFNDTPLHVVLIEALAHWTHPQRFAELDAQATLDRINQEFMAVPLQGSYLFDLEQP